MLELSESIISIIELVIIVGAIVLVKRSLDVIHRNVNSNLSAMRQENIELKAEVRQLLEAQGRARTRTPRGRPNSAKSRKKK